MRKREKGRTRAPRIQLLLLLNSAMSLVAVLARRLGMLLSTRRVLLSLHVVAITMMFSGRAIET